MYRSTSVAVVLVAMLALVSADGVSAQADGPPPLPIIYQGEVFLDGEPVANGTLRARIEDWETDAVPIVDGSFRCADPCLLVAPPDPAYVGSKVTFHLDGFESPATFSFDFPDLAEPRSETVRLFFETDGGGGFPWLWALLAVAAVVVAGGGGYVAINKRRGGSRTRQ